MRLRVIALALVLAGLVQAQTSDDAPEHANPAAAAPESPPFVTCPAGAPLGPVDLQVKANGQSLPFRTINRLSEDDTLLYAPVLRGKERRPGEVALVLVPAKRRPGENDIVVEDPKPADKPQEWKMAETVSVVALVYGPAGLSRKKVAKFLAQDEVLIAQLADYADKTAQAEQLVATLSNAESSAASVNAALNGFASQYGFAVQVDRNAPAAAQAQTVFAAMNPQLANYNPLASSAAQRTGQTVSMATLAATLFFGSPVGLAAGGTAMLLDLRSIAFPDTQFRASFAQTVKGSTVNLCGQQGPAPPHTRVAYIWASRIPNIPTPTIHIGEANYVPLTQKTALPVEAPEPGWKYMERARKWELVNDKGAKTAVSVTKLGNQSALEIDLSKAHPAPGEYTLTGLWDWTPLRITGNVHVAALSDFKTAHLEPTSQDRLIGQSGKVPVTVMGTDFEFTTKVECKRLNDEFATAENLPFRLPKGLREGPQDHMDIQIDTAHLDPGAYALLISQQDGKSHPVDFKVLPNPPRIDNFPVIVNQGAAAQHFLLKGQRLDLLTKLEAAGATLNLNPPTPNQTERSLTIELKSALRPGTALPVKTYTQDRSEPVTFPNALEITGPLPAIASSRLSLPKGMAIAVRSDEFPAGYTLNAMLDVRNIQRKSVLRLACADGVGESAALRIGEQTAQSTLQQLSPDQLFLAFSTSGLPAGCTLQGIIDNGRDGSSQPFALAQILRVPQIDSLTLNSSGNYELVGTNLEMIAKLGWDENTGVDVTGLPTPLAGQGLKQSLEIHLPDLPAPDAKLHVWLRGDKQSRATTVAPPPSGG